MNGVRHLKLEHLKKKARQDLEQGNYKAAYLRYTDALELQPDRDATRRLLSNRSLAYQKAGRPAQALEDALEVIKHAPSWAKGYFRQGSALTGLQRHPEAALAFKAALDLDTDSKECLQMMRKAVLGLTREQVAGGLVSFIQGLEAEQLEMSMQRIGMDPSLDLVQGVLDPAVLEKATQQELQESGFLIVKASQQDLPGAKPYSEQYIRWLKTQPSKGEALCQRAALHAGAKCFLQAREDAQSACSWYTNQEQSSDGLRIEHACAYQRLGEGFLACSGHPDRDCYAAAKAFAKGLDLDSCNPLLQEGAKAARDELSLEEVDKLQEELAAEGCMSFGGQEHVESQIAISLHFPQADPKSLHAKARIHVCTLAAAHFGMKPFRVQIESVKQAKIGQEVFLSVDSSDSLQSERIATRLPELERYLRENLEPDFPGGLCTVTYSGQKEVSSGKATASLDEPISCLDSRTCTDLATIPRPKQELVLPYKSYRLVTATGKPVERVDKHPFCMSRVYYDRTECPDEVWAEDADQTYRWRQTSSEVKIIALKVPEWLSAKRLEVVMEPFRVRVSCKDSQKVYLEGCLERGIVPRESVWMHDGGTGEDGFVLLLQKMNLELFQRHWNHSEMWWPKLFADGPEIAWDDYEKDYSDLPKPILQAHAALEAEKDSVRHLEHHAKTYFDRLQDLDDQRRLKRLDVFKGMKPQGIEEWSKLQHAIVGCS